MDLRMIKELRDKEGLSLLELGRRSGVQARMLGKMEKGEGNPSFDSVCRVMKCFGLSIYWTPKG